VQNGQVGTQKTDVNELYVLYRENYRKLKVLILKKRNKSSIFNVEIKLKGEVFGSNALSGEPFDFAIHTCGQKTYPSNLTANTYFRNHWTFWTELSSAQEKCIEDGFKEIKFDLEVFDNAVREAKGMWLQYISEKSRRNKVEQMNVTGQSGDILGLISSNYFDVLETVASDKLLKKIETYGPLERKGIISDKFLEIFIDSNYKCDHFEETECSLCLEPFLPQSLYEWPGLIPPIYCGVCLEMGLSASNDFFRRMDFTEDEMRAQYVLGVQLYSEYFGFIPAVGNQKRKVMSELFRSGIDIEELTFAMKVSSLLPWKDSVSKLFGSWAHLLEEAGLLTQSQRGRGGHRSIASDGHLCLSMGERAICEFLTKNGVTHEREPMYPFDELLNPNGLLRGDFLIGDLVIEFAGMMSNPEYAARMKAKEKLAKSRKIPWLKLESSSLGDLNEILVRIENKLASLPSGTKEDN